MFAMFESLRQRFGFAGQASRSTVRRPQVRLSLEALDDRIVPTTSPFSTAAFAPNSLGARYATLLQVAPLTTQAILIDPAPQLAATGTNAFTSTINLGLGPLHVLSQSYNGGGIWNLLGTFESINQIPIDGFNVSDDIGQLSFASGQIHSSPVSSGTAVFNGSTFSYYTNSIGFQASGSGTLNTVLGPVQDAQTVTFTGLVLSVWVNGQAVPVGVSGTVTIHDHVTGIPVGNPMADFDTTAVVPGPNSWLGTTWAAITH
jgi:hypothetical protein